jgi:hypothetical protein
MCYPRFRLCIIHVKQNTMSCNVILIVNYEILIHFCVNSQYKCFCFIFSFVKG